MNTNRFVEDIYAYRLAKDTTLYKNSDVDELDVSCMKHAWYALTEDDANSYKQKFTHVVKTKKEFRLLNVLHPMFQMDYVYRVNTIHPQLNDQKVFMLMSLGLPSHFAQETLLTHKPGVCGLTTPASTTIRLNAECYGGKHRYSFKIGERKPDDDMVAGLIQVYQDRFDGYIIPHEAPSCYHGGTFHPEVCLFKSKNTIVRITTKLTQHGGKKKSKKRGGNTSIATVDDHDRVPETLEEINSRNERHLLAIKWGGPRLYDSEGVLKTPTYDEIMRYRKYCLPPGIDDVSRDSVLGSRRADGVYTPHYDDEYWGTVKYNKYY